MKKEWYFRILISALALLIVMQEQTVVPNQEIVVNFATTNVTSREAQNAIAIVKKQLESIGVRNTRITDELYRGRLKISYYSDAAIESIKKVLSDRDFVSIDYVFYDQKGDDDPFPFGKNSKEKEYNLDVYEINKSADADADYTGTYVLEVKQEYDRTHYLYVYDFVSKTNTAYLKNLEQVAQKVSVSIAIAIDNTSYKIPEVRAGPLS